MKIAPILLLCIPMLAGAQPAPPVQWKLPSHVRLLPTDPSGKRLLPKLRAEVKPEPTTPCAHIRIVTPRPDIDPMMMILPPKAFRSNMPIIEPMPACEQPQP